MAELIPQLTHKDRGRFESFFWKGTLEECWNWTGATNKNGGYGVFWIKHALFRSHRVAYFLEYGEFDWELEVCHNCDNPICVNHHHLFLGTHYDNMENRNQKNRQSHNGNRNSHTENHWSKGVDTNVEEIRRLYKSGQYTQKQLSDMFGFHRTYIGRIINNQARKDPNG